MQALEKQRDQLLEGGSLVPLRVQVHQLHLLAAPHCGPRARICAAEEAGQAGGEAVLRDLNHRGRLEILQ